VTAISLPAARRMESRMVRRLAAVGLAAGAVILYILLRGTWVLPHNEEAGVFSALNGVRDGIDAGRASNPLFFLVIDPFRQVVDQLVQSTLDMLHVVGWPGVIGVAAVLGFLAGGWRLALLAVSGFVSLGALGLWNESIDTLGLTLAAVVLSLLIGIPLGIVAGRSDGFQRLINPILDVMQIMPAFAYLGVITLLLRIGGASAAIATLIYAMPAAIRITSLAIRGVPPASVEAAASLGATRWQTLRKVQLPLARRVIGLGINQTIMLALGMVVVTVLIGAPGLGVPIIRALENTNVGAAFDAGLAIVILAIILDRLTEHASERMDARRPSDTATEARRRKVLLAGLAIALASIVAGILLAGSREFPESIAVSFREPVNAATGWVKSNLFGLTDGIKNGFSEGFLNPLQTVLTTSPWWLVVAVVFGAGSLISGWRAATFASICLIAIAGLGLWQHGMETLASVLVATAATLLIGLAFGIWSARNRRFSAILRPILDFAQTMPSFVYLLPAVALFGASRLTAIAAAVIYGIPPVIRLVEAGIRSVPVPIIEAATSSGATRSQLLWKVQLPVARQALLLAANQGIVLVLAMVVVGGLVGAGALGYDVVAGFAQSEDFGKGLAAGISIVLLGVMLDRITQGAGTRRSKLADEELPVNEGATAPSLPGDILVGHSA
jgi:glycine betaine/proline transport system permease protein